MKLRATILATAMTVATASVASAQFLGSPGDGVVARSRVEQMQGFYGSLGGGMNWLQSTDMHVTDWSNYYVGEFGFVSGWTANGAVGYAFGIGPRVELELSYRRNHFTNSINGGGYDGSWQDGDFSRLNQLGLMANIAYDIYTGTRIVPYLGFGAGAVRNSLRMRGDAIGTYPDGDWGDEVDQWRLAVQGFGGVDFLLTQAIRIGARYTFLHTRDLTEVPIDGCCWGTGSARLDPNNHSVTLQVAYNFGAPRTIPAPPPSPAAAPAIQQIGRAHV